ncbi:MAG: hypothetical protein Q4D88_00695 [Anaerococcus sp.]|nr:hypothetical protein [Anaerococcus sp.]
MKKTKPLVKISLGIYLVLFLLIMISSLTIGDENKLALIGLGCRFWALANIDLSSLKRPSFKKDKKIFIF